MTPARSTRLLIAVWAALYAALPLLLGWSRDGNLAWLAAAAATTAAGCVLYLRVRAHITGRTLVVSAFLLLALACAISGAIAWRLHRLGTDWEQLQGQRTTRVHRTLDQRMAAVLNQGRRAAALAARVPADTARAARFDYLLALQGRSNVDAVALFGEQGELTAWAGEHRGLIPDSVRVTPPPIVFIEGPLYSYLYFNAPLEGLSGSATVAVLLDAALPSGVSEPGLAAQIDKLAGQSAFFLAGRGAPTDWNLVVGTDTLLHARLEPITQTQWRRELLQLGQRIDVGVGLVVLLLLGVGWFRAPARPRRATSMLPLLGMAAGVFAAPLGSALGLEQLFSPGVFLFPGPGEISLGSLLTVSLVCAAFVCTLRLNWRGRSSSWFFLAAIVLTLGLPIVVVTMIGPTPPQIEHLRAWTPTLFEGGAALWVALQFAMVILIALAASLVLLLARLPARIQAAHHRHRRAYLLLATSVALAGMLGLLVLVLGRSREQVTPLLALLWVFPILLAGVGATAYQREGRGLIRWLMAGWIAGTALLPYIWTAQVHVRLRTAERELATLGNRSDPYLAYLLPQFGREAIARRERGEDGLQLLYRSWVSSGLARESYSARITIWSEEGRPEVQLPLGDAFRAHAQPMETVPPYLFETFVRVREIALPEVFTAHDVENVSQVLVVPLDQGRAITVEVPSRRTLARTSAIAPILGQAPDFSTHLELVPKRTVSTREAWTPTEGGWRSEMLVSYPDGDYHAHLRLRLPSFGVLVARGLLILTADLLILLCLWLAGRALRGETVVPPRVWFGWLASFRGRITAALFAFFLLPTITFGYVAYRALAQEVTRAARMVAERAAQQAVIEFPDAGSDPLRKLSAHAGAEVLLYFQGEPYSVSSPEALQLGVYNAWMPPAVFLTLETGEEEADAAPSRIGMQTFITAFRRLQPSGTHIMAVPVSLQSGETALRQREMAHLVLFAALLGGLLSLALSVLVGRALAGPIGRLQRAAAAVGDGRLRIQLPEQEGGEFGRLFASFNRMVRRLQRARVQELRSARVLAWGEMARQVAHEIKNPLTPIKLAVQHLRRAYTDGRGDFERVLDQNVDQILVEIDRLTEIARAFSRYGAPPESAGPLETVGVASVVREALMLYRAGDLKLQYSDEIEPDLPQVFSRSSELKEVILNLLENARAATEPPGRITVVARRIGDGVELRVEDTGLGIPHDLLTRIFEPHFSTRTTGTGLGLSIVRRLVESWGGTVQAESEAGRGTTIRVRLAMADLVNA